MPCYPRDIDVSCKLLESRSEMCHYKIPHITLLPRCRCRSKHAPFLDQGPLKNQPDSKISEDETAVDKEKRRNDKKKRTISRTRQFAETKRGQIDRGRDRSKDRLPTTTETVTLGTTTTARLTSEISSASNSTQRPPIVLPPPRPVAAALTHSGGERRHPSGVSTRLPQDLGVERGRPAFRTRSGVFLARIRAPLGVTHAHGRASLPLQAIDVRTCDVRRACREERRTSGRCTQPVCIFSPFSRSVLHRARRGRDIGKKHRHFTRY